MYIVGKMSVKLVNRKHGVHVLIGLVSMVSWMWVTIVTLIWFPIVIIADLFGYKNGEIKKKICKINRMRL